ncbi:MAG: SpoIIE family protein phosphatase [Methylococcaceae bacterium]
MTTHPYSRLLFPLYIRVETLSHIGEAQRQVIALARDLGFGDLRTDQASLIVTEFATHLVQGTAGTGGDLVLRPLEEAGGTGLDILAFDCGPGIVNISERLRDGNSSTGLGAICRLSSEFDIFFSPGDGEAVFCRLWKNWPSEPALPPTSALVVGGVCLPVSGEQACGDAWSMKVDGDSTFFMLADGLGHGPDAAEAANQAVAIFTEQSPYHPAELLRLIHAGLRGTRGAAVLVVEVAPGNDIIRYAGLGNITGLILGGGASRHLGSHNGTAGVEARIIQEYSCPWTEKGLLVLHSDGVATGWSLDDYPGLAQKHPALIAGVLFRDHQRLSDDSTVVVAAKADVRRVME